MVNDPIADLLTRIRNAQRAGHRNVTVPASKMAERILAVLRKEGFIDGYETKKTEGEKFSKYTVFLRYYSSGRPVINKAERVSTPGARQYSASTKLPKVLSGLGISVVSTSQGVMSDREARKRKIGGEIIALVG